MDPASLPPRERPPRPLVRIALADPLQMTEDPVDHRRSLDRRHDTHLDVALDPELQL